MIRDSLMASSRFEGDNFLHYESPSQNIPIPERHRLSSIHHVNLTDAKIIAAFALGLGALVCALAPIALQRFAAARRKRICRVGEEGLEGGLVNGSEKGRGAGLELFLRWGGGILLATTFLHLLPEVREGAEGLGLGETWPVQVPELVSLFGFFLMYLVEEGAALALGGSHHHHGGKGDDNEKKTPNINTQQRQNGIKGGEKSKSTSKPPVMRGILIVIALSVHQIFEGMAIGLEASPPHVWVLLGAVAAHKLIIAICVGAEIASSNLSLLKSAGSVAVFALASPIGIGIGAGLSAGWGGGDSEDSTTLNTVSVILQGMATGTLLYVVFFEILDGREGGGEWESKKWRHYKGICFFCSTFLGFVMMTALLALVKDD